MGDDGMSEKMEAQHGKKPNQKVKPYIVLQFLLRHTDEDHVVTAYDIVDFLNECGIFAERRSIYRDIDEINRVTLMLQEGCTIDEAAELLALDKDGSSRLVKYDKARKGFYVQNSARQFDFDDIRMIAECVYSSKFLAEGQAKRLVEQVICGFVSSHQAERIKHAALLTDRVRTNNRAVINNISIINDAISTRLNGASHKPEQIRFKYLKRSIDNIGEQIERRHGETYTVSPFYLIINDGNYYLLGYNTARQGIRTYRVDRMKDVRLTGLPRDGEEAFSRIDIRSFAQRAVSMFMGQEERVTIQMRMSLLDTAVDQFGTKNVAYKKINDDWFTMSLTVDISHQFFAWLLRFGTDAKIITPESVAEQFAAYLDDVRSLYAKPAEE